VLEVLAELEELAMRARENLLRHLEKEETEVLPLIQKLFTNEEMARLVGAILGERPSELMHLILAMMFRCVCLCVCVHVCVSIWAGKRVQVVDSTGVAWGGPPPHAPTTGTCRPRVARTCCGT
jgi:hypothetical protein